MGEKGKKPKHGTLRGQGGAVDCNIPLDQVPTESIAGEVIG